MKTVYLFDPVSGLLMGVYEAQESPLEEGVYLAPVCSTEVPPPVDDCGCVPAGKQARWCGAGMWVLEDIPAPEPETPDPALTAQAQRRAEILASLAAIDYASLRPSRSVALAVANRVIPAAADVAKLTQLDADAVALRGELAQLAIT